MNIAFPFISFLVVAALVIGSLQWRISRSRFLLEQWAVKNGFDILHSESRDLFQGPFFWTTSRGQTVFYVRVRDDQGRERSGWIRFGGWITGLWTDKSEVKWEDESE
jgi:hypothetical protein